MFSNISEKMKKRMQYLIEMDAKDRNMDISPLKRLRQIPPEAGKFIAFLAATAPPGHFIEIGTSGGYSTMWLSLVARERKMKLKTFEVLPEKVKLARETFREAEIEAYVELIHGDAVKLLENEADISFCFLDPEKDVYEQCYDLVIPKLVPNGILIADNAISHQKELQPMLDKVLADKRVDALVVPIGTGELICRKI